MMKILKFYIFFLIFKFSNFLKLLNPLPMVYRPPYPWYIDPPTHGILNPLPMIYRPPYPWYFDPSYP
jgi:hypothetical protein